MKVPAAALVAVVVVVLGWLAWPSRQTGVTLHADNLTVTIADLRPGLTDVVLALTGPDATGAFIQVQAVMPMMGYATPEVAATATGAGHYTVTDIPLMTVGPWELRVRVTGRDALTLPFQVTG
jgi:hypothetical protein